MNRRKTGRTPISDLRVLACGVALKQYPRDDMLWEGLSRLDVNKLIDLTQGEDYIEKYQDNLHKDEKKCKSVFCRIARKISLFKYILSISRTARKEKVDVIYIFPRNHLLAICLALLSFFHKSKIYFNLHVSSYSIATSNSLGKLAVARSWIREFLSIVLANQLTCLTLGYAGYYQKTYKIGADKFSVVHEGVQDIWFNEPVSITHEIHRLKRVIYD